MVVLQIWKCLPVVGQLQSNLYECIRTHLLFFDQFFSKTKELGDIHVQIPCKPKKKKKKDIIVTVLALLALQGLCLV